jgi:neutral ceramidase
MERQSAFEIGIAAIDITPPAGVTLSGYGTRGGQASGVDHRLRAEALVCRGGDSAWALVTSDVVGYPGDFVFQVREQISGRCDLPAHSVLLSATHTHSGPAGQRTYGEQRVPADDAYREWLMTRLVDVVVTARDKVGPGSFEAAWTTAPDLGHNRRVIEEGICRNEWEDPAGEHDGFFDPAVLLVGVRRPDGRLDALVVNYGCHPVTLGPENLQISADYVGYLKDVVEAQQAAGTTLFALGGAADINPRAAIRTGASAPQQMGARLGQTVLQALADLRPLDGGLVCCVREPWVFDREDDGGTRIATEIQSLRAGALAIVAIPGELFSAYTARFRDLSPLPTTLVVTMANGAFGYLPLDESYAQGGLEVMRAACNAVEKPLTEHVTRALDALV